MGPSGELPPEHTRAETIRVLYVDSQPDAASRCTEALEREDDRFDARFETDTDVALERFETTEIDCLVSAYELGETNGLRFLEAVRTRDETVPFALFPKTGSETLASEAISAGITEYVCNDGDADSYAALATRIDAAVETTAIRRSREHRLAAIETAQEGIGLLDTDGRFVYVNRSYADCFGYDPSTLLGEHWAILYDETEATTIREDALPTVRADGEWNGETTAVRADDSRVIVDHTLSTTRRGELICTVRDVTGRKERERDLERYETIIEALGDPVYTVDADGRYAFVNDAYAALTGYDKSEIVGEPITFLLDEPSAERGVDAVRTLLSSGTDASQRTYDITVETSGGDRIECEDNVSLLPLEDGRYRGVAGVVRDITDRKERERELEQYETILETIPDVVYTLDADGRFSKIVPPTDSERTTFGYEPRQLIGEHVSRVLDDASVERGTAKVRELLRDDDRDNVSFEMDVYTRDGDCIPNENHIALLPMNDGEFRGTVGVLRDITERRARERELKRQNERLESFASVVSHDLRNPLTVARGQLELAREHRDDEHLETVARAHERMQKLIEDILALARQNESVSDLEPLDLEAFATVCWQTVETGTATLRTPTEAVVRADRSRFKQLLENLIRNAVEHGSASPDSRTRRDAVEHGSTDRSDPDRANRDATGGDDSAVTLTIGDLPEQAGFYVADDGQGIPPEERERVFENGYTTATDGTGFGLAIVGRIADAHGWTVTLTESDAGGARFEFRDVDVSR